MHRDSWRFLAYLVAVFLSSLVIGRAAMNHGPDAWLWWFLLCLSCVAATAVPLVLGRWTKVFSSRRHGGRHCADPRVRARARTSKSTTPVRDSTRVRAGTRLKRLAELSETSEDMPSRTLAVPRRIPGDRGGFVVIGDGEVTEGFTDRLQEVAGNGTGSLQVQDVTRERCGWVFLEDEDVVAVLVDGYQPRLGRRLTSSGLVGIDDMSQVLTVVKNEYDPRIAVECVTRGLVDAATMEVLYREFMLSAASSINEWDLGTYHWVADATPWEGRSAPVSVPALVNAMARREEHWAQLWKDLSAETIPDRIPVSAGRDGQYTAETPDESAVLAAVDGQRTVDEVAGECGFTRFQAGHLLAGLMAKRVLDLFPVESPRPVPDSLRVEAGYYAPPQPLPGDADAGAGEPEAQPAVSNSGEPPAPVAPRHGLVVPLAVPDPIPTQPVMDSPPQDPPSAVGPVSASNPEGNAVTQHRETEAASTLNEDDDPGEVDNVPAPSAEDVGCDVPGDELPPVDDPSLGDFFVNAGPSPLAVPTPDMSEGPAPEGARARALPPLPAITGGPSDFYVVIPSSPQTLTGGADSASEAGPDTEVAQLREDLLRMASERTAAMDKATLLRGRAVTHSVEADAAAARAEEVSRSISRLHGVTSEASAVALSQLEGLRLAQAEVAAADEIKARAEADAEAARRALAVVQRTFDEASAAKTTLQSDLQTVIDRREAVHVEWTVAKEGAARSESNARHADATVTECDQLMSEARERLTALAEAGR